MNHSIAAPYELLFFDADETLFDYSQCETNALTQALASFGISDISLREKALVSYREINADLWHRYGQGRAFSNPRMSLKDVDVPL